jgi:hypothetical protein
MKLQANKSRNKCKTGTTKWKPQLNDKVLVRCHPTSNAAQGITGKFQRPFEGPFVIGKIIPPSMYNVSDGGRKLRGSLTWATLNPTWTV